MDLRREPLERFTFLKGCVDAFRERGVGVLSAYEEDPPYAARRCFTA